MWIDPDKIPITSIRYIDFIREYNKRLLYGNSIEQDGFPFRDLARHDVSIIDVESSVHASPFDLIEQSHFSVEELTDLREFTYFAAKQYYSASPRFSKGVKIVNYHDVARGVESNFYCHVLHDAENACRASVAREKARGKSSNVSTGRSPEDIFLQLNTTAPFNETMSYQEIAITAYFRKKLSFVGEPSQFSEQLELWTDMIRYALKENNIRITDLPKECLYDFEIARLLEVSLRYEEILLPEFYASIKGERDLRAKFASWSFCSINAEEILDDPKFSFLFSSVSKFSVGKAPKVYVHVGAPKTGSTSIQDAMAADRAALRNDGYFLAIHGQVRSNSSQSFLVDNMLVECDRLGACIWSEEQRQIVASSGAPNAGKCPSHVMPSFYELLNKARKQKGQVVISNEWLNRHSSETGLARLLDDEWDPQIIIYYRRFYDWMESAHYQWHYDLGLDDMRAMRGKIRFIDFVRTYCSRLLKESNTAHSPDDADLRFVELTDIAEYTWHIAERYKQVPQFKERIKIVDFHKDDDVVKTFYCDVLGAQEACLLRTQPSFEPKKKTRRKSSTVLYDLAVSAWADGAYELSSDESAFAKDGLRRWTKIMADRMEEKALTKDDLPMECLSQREQSLLLNVSLAYEKLLLPQSYSNGGKQIIQSDFSNAQAKKKFCSVDTNVVLSSIEWKFLFEPF